jgi:hypothetical protein
MTESIQGVPPSLPPHVQLIQMGTGGAVANVVHIAAKLGLADKLADGPKSAAELADPLALHAPSLHKPMDRKALANQHTMPIDVMGPPRSDRMTGPSST